MKNYKYFIVFVIILLSFSQNGFSAVQGNENLEIKALRAKVTNILEEKDDYQLVELVVTEGKYSRQKLQAEFHSTFNFYGITLAADDEVFLTLTLNSDKSIKDVIITNVARDKYMIWLFSGYVLLLFIIGGFKGLRAVLSLILSYLIIVRLLIPLIINGYDPIQSTVVICSAITVITLAIIGGFNMKTVSAILGTFCGLIIAAVLAVKVGGISHITGTIDDEFYLLTFLPLNSSFSYQGLLFSGIIIGSLGAVMDVSMSIASSINELMENSHNMNTFKLIAAGMNVGRDAIGTMTNTLILAYAGGSIYMMTVLVAENTSLFQLINREVIASEILRSMAGSIGLIVTVPITAIIAGILMCKNK